MRFPSKNQEKNAAYRSPKFTVDNGTALLSFFMHQNEEMSMLNYGKRTKKSYIVIAGDSHSKDKSVLEGEKPFVYAFVQIYIDKS
jgi:hypothetical protein